MTTENPTEIRLTTPFGELGALSWGAPDAPPLLALHGWLDNAASFSRLAPRLAANYRVIALDLPGHGHSAHLSRRERRYHVIDQIDHVLDAADALGLETFDLLGHSLGAGIASLLAAAAPERLGRLLLIEGLGPLADDGSQTLTRWREAHAQRTRPSRPGRVFTDVDQAARARASVGDLDDAEVRPIVERNLSQCEGGYVWRSDARLRLQTLVWCEEAQVRRLLAGVTTPTLLLLADPVTPYLPTAQVDARLACLQSAHKAYIKGPHHLHIRCPDAVTDNIRHFQP